MLLDRYILIHVLTQCVYYTQTHDTDGERERERGRDGWREGGRERKRETEREDRHAILGCDMMQYDDTDTISGSEVK